MGIKWGDHGIPYVRRNKNKNKNKGASSPCSSTSSSSNETVYISPAPSFDSNEGAMELASESVFLQPLSPTSPPLIEYPVVAEVIVPEETVTEVTAHYVDAEEHMRVIRELKYADEPSFEYIADLPSMARGNLELPENEPPLKIIEAVAKYARNEEPTAPREIPDRPKVFGRPLDLPGLGHLDDETRRLFYPNDDTTTTTFVDDKPKSENDVIYLLPRDHTRKKRRGEKFCQQVEEVKKFSYKSEKDIPVVYVEDPHIDFVIIPDPPKPTFKKIDYDSSDQPPRIKYGFGAEEVRPAKKAVMVEKNDKRAAWEKKKKEGEHAEEQLEAYRYQRIFIQKKKEATNECDPNIKKREKVQDYIMGMVYESSHEQCRIINKRQEEGDKQRIRRKNDVGSYSWDSVDEKKMFGKKDTIMRFAWKGKLNKLKKHLGNSSTHKYINVQDNAGRTAVHFSASWDCPQTLQELLKVPGVDVNLRDDEGKTPLRKAVEIDSIDCVRMLIDFGANAKIEAYDKRNPFEFAIQQKGDDALLIIKYLYSEGLMYKEKKNNGCMTHMHQICIAKRSLPILETARALLENGAYINATEGSGQTPLMLAAQYEKPDLLRLFLDHGADVRHLDLNFQSALNWSRPDEACYNILREAMGLATEYTGRRGRGSRIAGGGDTPPRPVSRAMPRRGEESNATVMQLMKNEKDGNSQVIPDLYYDSTYKPKPCPVHLFYARPYVNEALGKQQEARQQEVDAGKGYQSPQPGPSSQPADSPQPGPSRRH